MKRLALAIGLLVLGFGAISPASADYAVVKFNSGYCRVWTYTPAGPQDGHYLWFRYRVGNHWRAYNAFKNPAVAHAALHRAVAHHRCHHWWG